MREYSQTFVIQSMDSYGEEIPIQTVPKNRLPDVKPPVKKQSKSLKKILRRKKMK